MFLRLKQENLSKKNLEIDTKKRKLALKLQPKVNLMV
jgi:hypothetical protein